MTNVTPEALGEIYTFAIQLGKDAGDRLMDSAKARFGDAGQSSLSFDEKESAVDIVTKTDEGKLYRDRDSFWAATYTRTHL